MLVIPTLEVLHGSCARLSGPSGSFDSAIAVVREWANAGFRRVHLIDSDALAGNGSNASVIDDVIRDGTVEVDACDGAQSSEQIERLIDAGAARVVLGPRALDEPEWLEKVAESYPGLMVVATEVRGRKVATRGWVRSLPHDLMDVVSEISCLPLGGLLVRSVSVDGSRAAFELSLLEDVAEACDFPVLASGDISSVSDLRALDNRGISAVLLGDRLHDGTLDPYGLAREFSD
jgi:phosphoribosylformimino-5-aminoimidazole carboxamide ribonucleotide (ProFAR) isomerase